MFKNATGLISKIITKSDLIFKNDVSAAKHYSYYLNAAKEYDFLHAYNYVGNRGIYWTHPESSYIIRVTDDFEQCVKGNSLNDNTCWWYFSKRVLPMMMQDFNEQEIIAINEELRNWPVIQSAPTNHFIWSTNTSRIYAAIPNVPYEQKVFSIKNFVAAFYTDDCIERLNSHPSFDGVANELAKGLSLIWNGTCSKTTDMNQFRGQDNISDNLIDDAVRALNIHKELALLARKVLKPKIYDLYNVGLSAYLRGCVNERELFQKHIPKKTFISEDEGIDTKLLSICVHSTLVTNMTEESFADDFKRLDWVNNLVASIVIDENDICGYFKDKKIDFCPMTFYGKLHESGKTELEAARETIKKSNDAKRYCDSLWEKSSSEQQEYYEYLIRYTMHFLDFNFCTNVRSGNSRYGWVPQLD